MAIDKRFYPELDPNHAIDKCFWVKSAQKWRLTSVSTTNPTRIRSLKSFQSAILTRIRGLEGTRPNAYDYGGHPAASRPALPNLINAVRMLKSKPHCIDFDFDVDFNILTAFIRLGRARPVRGGVPSILLLFDFPPQSKKIFKKINFFLDIPVYTIPRQRQNLRTLTLKKMKKGLDIPISSTLI